MRHHIDDRIRRLLALVAALLLAGAWVLRPEVATAEEPAVAPQAPAYQLFMPAVNWTPMPSSFSLIERAETRGEIDAETALVYAVFATFADSRLPAAFRGDDSRIVDADAVGEATRRFAELSPATRATLVPFLIPPVYAGSWYDLQVNGAAARAAAPATPTYIEERCRELAQGLLVPLESAHFVVWYPPLDAHFASRAQQISLNLESRIRPILTGLLREPVGDAGLGCNPGDGRLDVYLVIDPPPITAGLLALVSPYPGEGCGGTASYMLVLREGTSEVDVIAHEFMHMIQFSYRPAAGCYPQWWMEATADWAIDYFETIDGQPDDQLEHGHAKAYLETAWLWLIDDYEIREYGAYLWPFYLSHYTGSYHPELIADIFAATENAANGSLYQIIDDRIEGGWETQWPAFALLNLNLAPHDDYRRWDNFQQQALVNWTMPWSSVLMDGDRYWVANLANNDADTPLPMPDLGIYYERITIADDVRLWAFANTFAAMPHIRVQALLYRQGKGWEGPEDWSQQKWSVFCQGDSAEQVKEVIVIISNSNWSRLTERTYADGAVRVVGSDLSCAGWQGASTWALAGASTDGESTLTYTIEGEATPVFALHSRTVVSDVLTLEYQPEAGNATWQTHVESRNLETGATFSCDRSGGQTLDPALGLLRITENLAGNAMDRHFFGAGLTPSPDRCPGLESWTHVPWLTTELRNTELRQWPADATGRLQGEDSLTTTDEDAGSTTTSTWDFTAR